MANEKIGIPLRRDATQVKGVLNATGAAFIGAIQAGIAFASGSAAGGVGALSSFFKAFDDIKLDHDVEKLAYLLVASSLARTLQDALPAIAISGEPSTEALNGLAKTMLDRLANDIVIDAEFIEKPSTFPFLSVFAGDVALALEGTIPGNRAKEIEATLRRHFAGALYLAILRRPEFRQVEEALLSAAREPVRREMERKLYAQSLVDKFENLLLAGQEDEDDPVLLREVFVPLRGYHEELVEAEDDGAEGPRHDTRPRQRKTIRRLVEFERCAIDWIVRREPKQAVMIASGGPGMGKSSSLRALAARLVRQSIAFPVFLPLQFLEGGGKVEERIHHLLAKRPADRAIGHSFLDHLNEAVLAGPVVLMFDGLDELVQSGEIGDQALVQFVGQVDRFLATLNRVAPANVLALVSGRIGAADRAVKELNLRHDQVVHLLPFHVQEAQRELFADTAEQERLEIDDQRLEWWMKWSARRPDAPSTIPDGLLDDDLSDLSKEPLLLYFLAFAEFWRTAEGETGSRNWVYDQVLRKFHRRECEKKHSNLAKAFRDFDKGYEPVLQALGSGPVNFLADRFSV